jgi:hypothetical protein
MAIDFEYVRRLRDSLADGLEAWGRTHSDGLWASQVDRGATAAPSFTCSAICTQALIEAGPRYRGAAQRSASNILASMAPRNDATFSPLQSEIMMGPHTMNNAWSIFVVLECFPDKTNEVEPAVDWLMKAQENGWWNFVPGQPTKYPIFGAYAIVALAQYLKCANDRLSAEKKQAIASCITIGVEELLLQRSRVAIQQGVLFWHTKLSDTERIGIGTSAICAHAIDKAARLFDKPEWSNLVHRTMVAIGSQLAANPDGSNLSFHGVPLMLWDTVNQVPPMNYSWSAFAPLTGVPLLRHFGSEPTKENIALYKSLLFFLSWISSNTGVIDGRQGVHAGPTTAYVTTWSTAGAVIVLSRLLEKEGQVIRLEQNLPDLKPATELVSRPTAVHVVLLVHGINTRARWIHEVGDALEEAGFIPAAAGYGVFGILRFLLPFEFIRTRAIEKVRKAVRLAKEVHKPEKLSVIAHSFGSFIVARLLISEFDVKWDRIIFCGSVNNAELEVEQVLKRFTLPMLNDVGGRDYLPALAEKATRTFGSIGTYGALNAAVKDRFHQDKAHSGFLTKEFCKKWWIPFLQTGFIEKGDTWKDFPWFIRILLRVPWRLVIYAVLVAAIYGAAVLGRWLLMEQVPYRYSQNTSVARPYTDVGAAISATVSDIEANCRRGPLDRWLKQQQCISVQASSEVTALRACRSFSLHTRTPEEALSLLAQQYGDCFSVTDGGSVLSVNMQPDKVTRVTDRQGTWFMCSCTQEQIRPLESQPR